MKTSAALLLGCFVATTALWGQITIRSSDMFSKVGEYYRTYGNLSPQQTALFGIETIPIREQVGESGGPHLWDFTDGPTDEPRRFDYVDPSKTIVGASFPGVTLAERMTLEATGDVKWLLLEQVPLVGRRVFGTFDTDVDELARIFDQPIVDFPDPMQFGDTWSTSVTFTNTFSILGLTAKLRTTQIAEYEVDAWGEIELPNLGFGQVLRVNVLTQQIDAIEADALGGSTGDPDLDAELGAGPTFTDVQQTYFRSLFFLRKGLGIVAQIISAPSPAPPGENFQEASQFVRMFETNKVPPELCTEPGAVDDLDISYSGGRALLKWGPTDCTDSYRVEYSNLGGIPGSWKSVGETQGTFLVAPTAALDPSRIYRVISRKADFIIK